MVLHAVDLEHRPQAAAGAAGLHRALGQRGVERRRPVGGAEGDLAARVVHEQRDGTVLLHEARGVAVEHRVRIAPLHEGQAPEVLPHVDVDGAVGLAVVGEQPLRVQHHRLRAGQADRLPRHHPFRAAWQPALARREGGQVQREAADHGAGAVLDLDGGGEPVGGEVGGRPHREGQLLRARPVDAGGRFLQHVHGVDGALGGLQRVLPRLGVGLHERRVVALDLHAQAALAVVHQRGVDDRGQRGRRQQGQRRALSRAESGQTVALRTDPDPQGGRGRKEEHGGDHREVHPPSGAEPHRDRRRQRHGRQ